MAAGILEDTDSAGFVTYHQQRHIEKLDRQSVARFRHISGYSQPGPPLNEQGCALFFKNGMVDVVRIWQSIGPLNRPAHDAEIGFARVPLRAAAFLS